MAETAIQRLENTSIRASRSSTVANEGGMHTTTATCGIWTCHLGLHIRETLTSFPGPTPVPRRSQVDLSVRRILMPPMRTCKSVLTCPWALASSWASALTHLPKPRASFRDAELAGQDLRVGPFLWGPAEASLRLMQGLLVSSTSHPGSSPDMANPRAVSDAYEKHGYEKSGNRWVGGKTEHAG